MNSNGILIIDSTKRDNVKKQVAFVLKVCTYYVWLCLEACQQRNYVSIGYKHQSKPENKKNKKQCWKYLEIIEFYVKVVDM